MADTNNSTALALLSELLFRPDVLNSSRTIQMAASLKRRDLGQLWEMATTHHVILRAFPLVHRMLVDAGSLETDWIEAAMASERTRIHRALSFLSAIYGELGKIGHIVVIKSLDHSPDLGSDLDLYSTAHAEDVAAVMRERFQARPAERSWGDRVANKWNFIVPGLPELVELHIGRLGQMGEQVAVTNSLVLRATEEQFGSHTFLVPRPEDRLVISTLQRMYRHFYLRLCDIVDNYRLIASGSIDYGYLESLTRSAGLWDGLSTYMTIIGDYVEACGGNPLRLPPSVIESAQFGGQKISFRKKFLRIPLFQATSLYAKEWTHFLRRWELQNTLRLSLLPGLAVAAALTLKLTGSDKGIW